MELIELNGLVKLLKERAIQLPLIHSVYDGDVYDNWNSNEVKYGSLNIGLQSVSYDGNFCTYNFILYYGDRLLQYNANRNSVISDGINAIQSVLNYLDTLYYIDVNTTINYTPFEQKFADYLAGVYCNVSITTESTVGVCSDMLDDTTEPTIDYKGLVITSLVDDNEIGFIKAGNMSVLQYSYDGNVWMDCTATDRFTLQENQKICFRGIKTSGNNTIEFDIQQPVSLSGNILYLVNYENPTITGVPAYGLNRTFYGCKGIINAKDLTVPVSTTANAYNYMFTDCINMEITPTLIGTMPYNLTTMTYMFSNCKALKEIWALITPLNANQEPFTCTNFAYPAPSNPGIFYKAKTATWKGYPVGWVGEDVDVNIDSKDISYSKGYEAGINTYNNQKSGIATLEMRVVNNDEMYQKGYEKGIEDAKIMEGEL